MLNPVIVALQRAVRTRGSEPLLTWYGSGARVELSVRTFANWVDKTANLIESLDAAGGTIAGPLSATHPGNWMTLVWPLAAWQAGCTWVVTASPDAVDLVVTGPEEPVPHAGTTTIACSLHPLALGLSGLPHGVLDFSTEALSQPDAHWAQPVGDDDPAWTGPGGRSITHADLGRLPGEAGRRLVVPTDAFGTLLEAVLYPLLGGGSVVLVDDPVDADQVERICRSERVTGH